MKINKELWKSLPYWLKGGIIGGLISVVFVILYFSCFILSGSYSCLVFATYGPMYFSAQLANYFSDYFGYDWIFAEAYAWLISIPLTILVTLIVGLLIGFIKSRKIFRFLIVVVILIIVFFSSNFLVTDSKPGIVSISPSEVRIGDTLNIKVKNFDHNYYSYIKLSQYGSNEHGAGYFMKGQLWVGKIPQTDIVSFVLKGNNCLDSSCDISVDLTPGKYKIQLLGSLLKSNDVSANVEQEFIINS